MLKKPLFVDAVGSLVSRIMITSSSRLLALLPVFLLLLLLLLPQGRYTVTAEESESEMKQRLIMAAQECTEYIANVPKPADGVYCDAMFDGLMCWPYTPAGTVAIKSCPDFIHQFNAAESATRICQEDGSWFSPLYQNITINVRGWTNYSACVPTTSPEHVLDIFEEHIPIIGLISKIGYSISLVSLVVATTIMVGIRQLHCKRNVIHINLFVSFILRAAIILLKDLLFVGGLGLPKDLLYHEDGLIEFNPHGPHWECKLLITLFIWSLCSSSIWIFVEGLYLHTIIFFAVFEHLQNVIFKWYIIFGWGTPFCIVIPWVVVRIFYNDTFCWTMHDHGYLWIVHGPIAVFTCISFCFFLNIVRFLYFRIRASTAAAAAHRYRKLAKSTLMMTLMFGVYYIFFVFVNYRDDSHPRFIISCMYIEITLNSFQGFIAAVLYCFTNGEVRSEILKRWQRHRQRN